MPANYFVPGDWNAICDRCGFKFKASMLRAEWQGLMTCPTCWETKHPSLMQLTPTENTNVPWVRPEAPDQFVATPAGPSPSPAPSPVPPPGTAPNIANIVNHPVDWLEIGDYFIDDGRQGTGTFSDEPLVEGPADYNFQQFIERSRVVNPEDSSIACRWNIRWPHYNSIGHSTDPLENPAYSEVKTYPSIIFGKKPGYQGNDKWPAYSFVRRAPDGVSVPTPPSDTPTSIASVWQPAGGSIRTDLPSGASPGKGTTIMPLQLPLRVGGTRTKTCFFRGKYYENAVPTGRGHLSFDFFLTQNSAQTNGFSSSSITHEIMIPIRYWGNYGAYGYRSPSWYDHDVTIDGVLYHVYYAKDLGRNDSTGNYDFAGSGAGGVYPGLRYTFGGLNPNYTNEETGVGRIGWKFIVFEPDTDHHPLDSDGYFNIDFSKFADHLAGRTDSRGIPVIRNTEYIASLEFGIEQVWGTADITVYNYMNQVSNTADALLPKPAGNNS